MSKWTGLEATHAITSNRAERSVTINGTDRSNKIDGTGGDDLVRARAGDDLAFGNGGDDILRGGAGFDVLYGNKGDDQLFGDAQGDFLYGGDGNDVLFGDTGYGTAKGGDLAADRLDGGAGDDRLIQGDGNDVMTGGSGADRFVFRFQDPMVALAAGTGRAFTAITDFDAGDDTLRFDAAGAGRDRPGANFVDGGAGDGTAGGIAASFFSGGAADSNGEAVVVLTEQAFATGADAVLAAQGEAAGDLIVYFNATVGVASLLYVDGPDAAHSIARLTDINSIGELAAAGFTANDFLFA